MSYAKLHEMLKKKFNMEEDDRINISVSLPSFDSRMEITDNEESPFENIGSSNEERNTSFFNNNHTNTSYFNDDPYVQFEYNAKSNEFVHKNDPNFTKPESSFAFGTYDENENEQNDCFDGVDENPQPFLHKLKNFMTFKPDIPETPLYKSKPLISTHYKKDSEVKIGNTFDNKEALDLAVRLKAIQEGYQFVSQRTDPNRYERKCYHFKECAWSIHAKRWGNTDLFQIIRMNDVHTCPKTQTYPNHRNANKKVIAHILNPKLQDNRRVLKGKDIQHDILLEYKTSISYQQAWRGKDYGLDQIRGSPYESFEMLPYYCYNLERKNQGSVTRIKTDDKGVFEMLFIALGASIRTFLNYLRPLLIIDAAHLKGTYKGTNLVAVGMDGNNQIVPVAFGICKGETGPCWSWWMSVLKECIGDHSNLLFISDRHPAIALAVHNEFPLSYHAVCCRHLMMNLSLKKKTTKGLFWKICKTYTPDEFTANMNIMQVVQPDAYSKLCQAGTQRWSRAHCPLVRYNYMTSNSVESVNACSVINRKLPVLMLAETYRAMLQEWYFKRQKLTENMKYEITDWAAHKVHKRKLKSATWIVHGVNQIPCGHVIAITRDMQEWEFLSHIHPAIPPRMDNPQPGRPKNTNRIPSQEVDGYMLNYLGELLFVFSTNVVKLIGFTKDDDPIVEVDRGRMLHPLQVYDRASEEFHNVGISADGGSFFIGPYKESLILLNV
ncbi:transposase, MuDR, MULE transposase domain protein [Tanacetum coccineum]